MKIVRSAEVWQRQRFERTPENAGKTTWSGNDHV